MNPDAVGQREPKYQPHGSHRSTKALRAPEASSQWDLPPFSTLPILPPPETTMAGQENRQRVGLPVQGRVVGRVGPLRTKHFLRPLLLSRPLPCPSGVQGAKGTSGTSRSLPAPTNFLLSRTVARRPSRQTSLGWGRRRSPRSFRHQSCPPQPHCRLEVPGA